MKSSHFLIQCFVLFLMLAGYNVAVKKAARNSQSNAMLRQIDATPDARDIFAGNSLMAAGFDAKAFAAAEPNISALNLSLGATLPPEHYLLLKRANTHAAQEIVYGFYDRQLTDPDTADWSDIAGNRNLGYLTDLNSVLPFYTANDPLKKLIFKASSHFPIVVDRSLIWSKAELLRRKIGEMGLPHESTNQFGRAADFSLLEASDEGAFASTCQEVAKNNKPFAPSVTAMVELARSRGLKIYFVEMPMPGKHRKRFYDTPQWLEYREYLRGLVEAGGNHYIDASTWMKDDLFADALHLSPQGAPLFTRRLMETLDSRVK